MDDASPRPDLAALYGLDRWGHGYFEVTGAGELALRHPGRPDAPRVSLPAILRDLNARGIHLPILLRVADFLENEICGINEAFAEAMARMGYRGAYRGVFPIKVNQQAQVVDRIVEAGRPWNFGLEAGSKPELVIALAHRLPPEAMVICNGIKDAEFVQLATLSRKLGFNTVIVLESPREAEVVIETCRDLDIAPLLGVRVKLTNKVTGNWSQSSGDRSTFGMTTAQLVEVVDRLREAEMLDCLQLQHSHLGSQVPDVNDIRRSVAEACRYFVELTGEGVPLTHLDLGGGLGVDYTGERKATVNSINYSTAEYAMNVVEMVAYAMDEAGIDHPVLVTESGRAVSATSSMLLFNVLEATHFDAPEAPAVAEGDHHLLEDLAAVGNYVRPERLQECLNDATFYRDELRALFRRGQIGLRQMARAEQAYMHLTNRIRAAAAAEPDGSDVDDQLEAMADIYHCNFSLFQSLPDVWAIDQLHPVMPLQRLDEAPDRRVILSDITCDSDGKIDRFILGEGIAPSLPVHSLRAEETYNLGVFFVGAYQETLGDLHNLFGDTNVATIRLTPEGHFDLLHEQEGDSVSEVLSYVEYNAQDCLAAFRRFVDEAMSAGTLAPEERRKLMGVYRDHLTGYTYYE